MKTYDIKVNGKSYCVTIDGINADGTAEVTVNGKKRSVEVSTDHGISVPATTFAATLNAGPANVGTTDSKPTNAAESKGMDITSPLPGVILSLNVAVGEKVTKGQTLAVLEAMKMENAIEAEKDGTVLAIYVQKGDSILEGAKIITIA